MNGTDQSPSVRLPRRPRLLPGIPVLRRNDHSIQIGTDPRHAVVLSAPSAELLRVLAGLDGAMTCTELLDQASGSGRAQLRSVLEELTRGRLLEDACEPGRVDETVDAGTAETIRDQAASAVPKAARLAADATTWALRTGRRSASMPAARARSSVVVHGDGRIAVALACLLAAAGVGWVHVAAKGTVTPGDLGSGYIETDVGTPRSAAAARAVRRCAESVRTARMRPSTLPDLAMLADCAVPDPHVVSGLLASGTPHMVARVREGIGWVGPLVFPQRTSCLRCLDLHRTDLDPCWPMVAAQLADRAAPADIPSAMATAAYAAGHALRVLDGEGDGATELTLCDSTIQLNPFDGQLRRRRWAPHPACGCGAAVRVTAERAG